MTMLSDLRRRWPHHGTASSMRRFSDAARLASPIRLAVADTRHERRRQRRRVALCSVTGS